MFVKCAWDLPAWWVQRLFSSISEAVSAAAVAQWESRLLSEGCWFDSPDMHKIVNPKLLLMCWSAPCTPPPSAYECMNYCKSFWTNASSSCVWQNVNDVSVPQMHLEERGGFVVTRLVTVWDVVSRKYESCHNTVVLVRLITKYSRRLQQKNGQMIGAI